MRAACTKYKESVCVCVWYTLTHTSYVCVHVGIAAYICDYVYTPGVDIQTRVLNTEPVSRAASCLVCVQIYLVKKIIP